VVVLRPRHASRRAEVLTGAGRRARLAPHSYSYLHLPMVAGVMFFALGVHEAVADAAEPLRPLPAAALAGGVALFFIGDVAYRWRDHHQLAADRLLAAAGAAALIPVAMFAPALAALVGLTLVCLLQTGWELWRRPAIGPVDSC